ncbi:mercuric ion transporter MerT, partial [Kaarinaea lacus]
MDNVNVENTANAPTASEDNQPISTKGTLIAGLLAGLTASACCAGPLILLMLGISGSWIGNLSALEPYRPIFILVALVFLGLAFRKIYLKPQACSTDAVCATQQGKRSQQIIFWITTLIVVLSIAFPWYGP